LTASWNWPSVRRFFMDCTHFLLRARIDQKTVTAANREFSVSRRVVREGPFF
jgi:hypothetical protein